jgi:hypothetical protein
VIEQNAFSVRETAFFAPGISSGAGYEAMLISFGHDLSPDSKASFVTPLNRPPTVQDPHKPN